MPVSYTHLAFVVLLAFRIAYGNGLVFGMDGDYFILPVSYTHLDVYKRQVSHLPIFDSCFYFIPCYVFHIFLRYYPLL